MLEHRQAAESNAKRKIDERVKSLEDQRLEAQNIRDQIAELKEIEHERKLLMQQEMRDSVKQITDERNMFKDLQRAHDKKFGFQDFPYTHGEALEKAQAEMKKKAKVDMQIEMERRKNLENEVEVSLEADKGL